MAPTRRGCSKSSASRTKPRTSAPKSKTTIPRSEHKHPQPTPQAEQTMTVAEQTMTLAGLPTMENYQTVEAEYLASLSIKKRDKALIDLPLFQNIWDVLTSSDEGQSNPVCTPQFRFWVKKMFSIRPAPTDLSRQSLPLDPPGVQMLMYHNDRPVAVRDKIYQILCAAHEAANHGGRDRTDAVVRTLYSYVPKELVNRFVSACPTCRRKKAKNSRYRHLPWAVAEAADEEGKGKAVSPENSSEGDTATTRAVGCEPTRPCLIPAPISFPQETLLSLRPLSKGTGMDSGLTLPVILGWDGPTTIVPESQMHLHDAAHSIFNARSRWDTRRYNSGSGLQRSLFGEGLNVHSWNPSQTSSHPRLRPILGFDSHDTLAPNQPDTSSENMNLPPLFHVVPKGVQTGLGIEMSSNSDTTVISTSAKHGPYWNVPLAFISEEGYRSRDSPCTSVPLNSITSMAPKASIESRIDPALFGQGTDVRTNFSEHLTIDGHVPPYYTTNIIQAPAPSPPVIFQEI